MRYLLNLSYDGSKYFGYQVQKNEKTIAGELNKILSKIFNDNIITIGASRTDKGVHSIDQYCHFDTDKQLDLIKLKKAINKLIDKSIYVKKIEIVDDNFHSRYSVKKKIYIYKINMGTYNPIEKDYILQYNKKIEKELLNRFTEKISGTHNFKSFTSDKDSKTYERTIKVSYLINKKIIYLRFESTGFLRYMIRNIVGLLLDINDEKIKLNDIDNIFKSENRTSSGRCAPAEGLYLNKIEYWGKLHLLI